MPTLTLGVLALQGAFSNHEEVLHRLGVNTIQIRQLKDLDHPLDGLILPGGESTVQSQLLHELGLFEPLRDRIGNGLPTYGTCAGLILLAKNIAHTTYTHLGLMDITVLRNAFGRQYDSFIATEAFADYPAIEMPFIRAPRIESVGPDVVILAQTKGQIVAAREKNMLVTAFHPEVTLDGTVHSYFIEKMILKH